jgi:hypothetical protein
MLPRWLRSRSPDSKSNGYDKQENSQFAPGNAIEKGKPLTSGYHGVGSHGFHDRYRLAGHRGGERRRHVVGNGLFFVQAEVPGVGAYKTLIEDPPWQQFVTFFFQGLQHAGTDFGGHSDIIERNAFALALLL